jgi:glycosyltransferase involved in cell wall biosynthesis
VVRDYYRRCKALIFPGEEDFGIVPVEAQACGKPVIAFGKGGALETVIPLNGSAPEARPCGSPTGVFFYDASVDALCDAVAMYQRHTAAFDPAAIRQNALRFDRPEFKARITAFLADKMGMAIV